MAAIAFSTAIGPVAINCVISEKHTAELDITEIPIETGARVTDHAVVMPKKLTLDVANDGAAATYNALVRFQESRVPFSIVTGLKVYSNMLIKHIDAERDATFSRVLRAKVDLQEIIIVSTAYAADPGGETGGERGQPSGRQSTRAAPPTSERASDAATANRASGTVQRGDAGIRAASPADQSYLSRIVSGPVAPPVTTPVSGAQ